MAGRRWGAKDALRSVWENAEENCFLQHKEDGKPFARRARKPPGTAVVSMTFPTGACPGLHVTLRQCDRTLRCFSGSLLPEEECHPKEKRSRVPPPSPGLRKQAESLHLPSASVDATLYRSVQYSLCVSIRAIPGTRTHTRSPPQSSRARQPSSCLTAGKERLEISGLVLNVILNFTWNYLIISN